MTARIKISQAGLSAGVAGRSRTDGLATGALVTIEDVSGAGDGTSTFHLLWVPPNDTTVVASLAVTVDKDVWTFSPQAARYGSYEVELRVNGVPVERRIFGIRTPANGLLIPALNERASRHANLLNAGADQIDLCEQNANDFPLSFLNNVRYAGWWRSLYELYNIVELGIGSIANNALALIKLAQQPAKSVLVNATNATGNVSSLAASAALRYLRVNAANNALEWAEPVSPSNVNMATTSGALGVVDISALECGGSVTLQTLSEASIDGFTAKSDGFWFILHVRDSTTSASVSLNENVGNTTTSIRTPDVRDWRLTKNDSVMLYYFNGRWRIVGSYPKPFFNPSDSVTWAAQQNDFARSSRGIENIRATLTGNQTLTGVVPDGVTPNGEMLIIENIDTADTLQIAHDATSTAANRFLCPGAVNFNQGPLTSTIWRYDGTVSRWRMSARS